MTMALEPPAAALGFIDFVNKAPTPYHAVRESITKLEGAGFKRLREKDAWSSRLTPGSKHYVTRNMSSIIAFVVPHSAKPASSDAEALGISLVGCHTDSPNFRVRAVSRKDKGGYAQVGVETYGGGIWATWLDRDLSIAGRVSLASSADSATLTPGQDETAAESARFSTQLVKIERPILRMPTLAIHLSRDQNDKMYYNPETQQVAILALASKTLNAPAASGDEPSFAYPHITTSHHHPILLHAIADELSAETDTSVSPSQIVDFDLSLYDTQPACIGGALNEFIFAPRCDNLFSSFCAVEGIIAATADASAEDDGRVKMIALWDHEEIGSVSACGAESNFVDSVIARIASAFKGKAESDAEAYGRTLARSFLLSCDMAHGFHPAFPEKYEENHRPRLNAGPVIKTNAKQRYASTSHTTLLLRQVARRAAALDGGAGGVPLQEYEVRNDMACGSTIGPLVSQKGLRTVDIGCPQLSMHSCREMAGAKDAQALVALFKSYFEHFGKVDGVVLEPTD